MNAINGIKKWAKERQIDKMEFRFEVDYLNILEELIEGQGYQSKEAREKAEKIFKDNFKSTKTRIFSKTDVIDCLADICVFSMTGMMKLGFDPSKVLHEVLKEISSRKQDPKQKEEWELNGIPAGAKWQKDLSQDKSTLYKADFSKCMLKGK